MEWKLLSLLISNKLADLSVNPYLLKLLMELNALHPIFKKKKMSLISNGQKVLLFVIFLDNQNTSIQSMHLKHLIKICFLTCLIFTRKKHIDKWRKVLYTL